MSFNDHYADWKYLPKFIFQGVRSCWCNKCNYAVLLPWSHVEKCHPEDRE